MDLPKSTESVERFDEPAVGLFCTALAVVAAGNETLIMAYPDGDHDRTKRYASD